MKYKSTIFLFCFYFSTILYSQVPKYRGTNGNSHYDFLQTLDRVYIHIGTLDFNNINATRSNPFSFANGMYMILLKDREKTVVSEKLIIKR
ncbi:hypothetical protein RM51_04375 [Chryseobacterium taiwanense]|uniref:Uncharacterized protein n=1 Tax=Chryseobacterium taiwanense TaxID=363331 RepID=A0A0B4DHP2_9FLAO|nr:hypothetical protein RM51_04375 [Chryseobacterium taiwanense]